MYYIVFFIHYLLTVYLLLLLFFGYSGPSDDVDNFHHELRGIIPRSFEFLFNLINREIEMVSINC